jgi:hypothetical protein
MVERNFVVNEVTVDGETMLRVMRIDSSGRVNSIDESITLTQNLEVFTGDIDESERLQVGDTVRDLNPPDWSSEPLILEIDHFASSNAYSYQIDYGTTVADANPDYPAHDDVAICSVVGDSDKEYAYPVSRLQKHDFLEA